MAIGLDNPGFSDALVILGAAGLVIPAFARFRVSPVIGFILVGLLVGPAGLGSQIDRAPWLYYVTISDPEAIEPFAEFGIVRAVTGATTQEVDQLIFLGQARSYKSLFMTPCRKLVPGPNLVS